MAEEPTRRKEDGHRRGRGKQWAEVRVERDELAESFAFPMSQVGRLIGVSGGKVREVKNKSGVKIMIEDKSPITDKTGEHEFARVTLTGSEQKDIDYAFQLILEEFKKDGHRPDGVTAIATDTVEVSVNKSVWRQIEHRQFVRNMETRIEDQTGCQLKLNRDWDTQEFTVMKIIGPSFYTTEAKRVLLDALVPWAAPKKDDARHAEAPKPVVELPDSPPRVLPAPPAPPAPPAASAPPPAQGQPGEDELSESYSYYTSSETADALP